MADMKGLKIILLKYFKNLWINKTREDQTIYKVHKTAISVMEEKKNKQNNDAG